MADNFFVPLPKEEEKGLAPPTSRGAPKGIVPVPKTYTTGKEQFGPPMPPMEPINVVEDVGKTVATNVPKGFAQSTIGFGGDIGNIAQAGQQAYNEAVKRRLMAPSTERQMTPESDAGREVAIGRERMMQNMRPTIAEAERVLGPTHYGLSNVLSDYFPSSESVRNFISQNLPFMDYEPKTEIGKKFEHPSQVAGSVGGPGGLPRNVGRMIVAGGSSLLGGEAEGAIDEKGPFSWAKPYIVPAAEILGMHFGPKVGGIAAPSLSAEEKAAAAIREDRARRASLPPEEAAVRAESKMAMTPAETEEALRLGTPISGVDVGGANTRQLLEESAAKSPSAAASIRLFNEGKKSKELPARDRVIETAKKLTDYPDLNFGDLNEANRIANKAETKRLYDIAMTNPNANSIAISPSLSSDPIFRTNVDNTIKDLDSLKKKYGYEDLDVIPPTPAGPPFTYFDQSLGKMVTTRTPGTNGNLAFYDIMKKHLYELETKAAQGQIRDLNAYDLQKTRQNLVKELDTTVDEYATARNAHAEAMGANNAHEYGLMLGQKAGSIPNDEMNEVIRNLPSYSDEQISLLRHGYLNGMIDQLNQPGGLQKLANQFVRGGNININAKKILGDDAYYDLKGKIVSENFRAITNPIDIPPASGNIASSGIGPAMFGAAIPVVDAVATALMSSQFVQALQDKAPLIATGAGLGALSGVMTEARARRIATEIGPMLLDPAQAAKLSRLAEKDPSIAALMQAVVSIQPVMQQYRESGQKSGGRIGRATGGRAKSEAMRLVAMADAMKKKHNETTKPLLDVDDSLVAKALEIANKDI